MATGKLCRLHYTIQNSIAALIRCQMYTSQSPSSSVNNPRSSIPSPTSSGGPHIPDVPGLSTACVASPSGEVGPGASKSGEYKNPEYFCYNSISYFEAEIEMAKYRLPQPSSGRK